MASVAVYSDRVVIRLSAAEKALALRRRDLVLDRAAITSALITDDPWVWLRGVRSPGAHLPGKLALGTWRGLGGREFAAVRNGKPAVVLDFSRETAEPEAAASGTEADAASNPAPGFDDFARVVISTDHAAELIRALRLDDSDAVFTAGA